MTFAFNYALGGLTLWGYHAVNLAIHTANALLLFGILRRTMSLPAIRDRLGDAAIALSAVVALFWALHPLQTESVTYIVQRAESLVGLFYLLTLYCVIRGAETARPTNWYLAAICACLLGMGAKEVMVTAPVIVLLYDRTFLGGSFMESLQRRRWLYAGLAMTWTLLFYLVAATGELSNLYASDGRPRAGSDSLTYAMTQPGAILNYLKLSFWPNPLVLDYGRAMGGSLGEVLPAAVFLGLLFAATAYGVYFKAAWGFAGAWFFIILSPTSSIVPLFDDFSGPVFEHRVYLPLAAPICLLVLSAYLLGRSCVAQGWCAQGAAVRLGVGSVAIVATALCGLTIVRNKDYSTAISIYQDTVSKAPGNPRSHNNLGLALAEAGRPVEAIAHYQEALRLKPSHPEAHNNLALTLAGAGRREEAIAHYLEALRSRPTLAEAHDNLGLLFFGMGRTEEAIAHFRQAVALKPAFAGAHSNLADAVAAKGRLDEAITQYGMALKLNPALPGTHNNLAIALVATGRIAEAIQHYRTALRLRPGFAEVHNNLGIALARGGQVDEAMARFREAFALKPDYAEAHNNLGIALFNNGDRIRAREEFVTALRIKPDYAEAKRNLDRLAEEGARKP